MKRFLVILALFQTFVIGKNIFAQSDNILWYEQPAQYFEESLVLGNGKMGASV